MSSPETVPEPRPRSGPLRRMLAAAALTLVLFGLLWYTVFSAVTAALVASGGTVVLVAGASLSDAVEMIFEAIANALLAVLAVIAAVFAAIMSVFDL